MTVFDTTRGAGDQSTMQHSHDGDQPDRMERDGVAIIGMACLFPGAPNLNAYWHNILGKVDAVTDPPAEAWDADVYYDPDSTDSDRVYCKRGGYLGSMVSFDPLAHGIPPMAVGGEPDQWLALQLARDALADAGYAHLDEHVRQRTAVILGKGTYLNGGNAIAVEHGLMIGQTVQIVKTLHPEYTDEQLELIRRELKRSLPPMGPEIVPGLIPNVIVGRIANRLDLMGPTYTVDAACASSLVAVQLAMRDLLTDQCDLALVGGAQVWVPVVTMNVFCQLGALSRRQQIRPFDAAADGTLLGEGIGMVVLKRRADAERDGDRIYAVIKGVGVASDGRGVSVMAPRVEGEELALRRAYEAAGVAPQTVGLIEAHGTATPVGDVVEVQALTRVFGQRDGEVPRCALGSVKSMISHTMPAAGVAGLIKVALALYHKVLPPTLNCDEPNPKLELEKTPFYLNTETRPWVHGGREPRRAGVNAFGFGGINAHVVLEEYADGRRGEWERSGDGADPGAPAVLSHAPVWDSEVCILEGASPADLLERVGRLVGFLEAALADNGMAGADRAEPITLKDLAYTLNSSLSSSRGSADAPYRLAVVALSLADLQGKLVRAAQRLAEPGCRQIKDVSGIYFAAEPLGRQGKLAFVFPGEGAQYPNMLADLCLHFPEVRARFDQSDRIFAGHPRGYLLSDFIFPRPWFSEEEKAWAEKRLWEIDGAVEAVLTANEAMLTLLRRLGLRPDAIVGHSTGEYSAMRAAGILALETEEHLTDFSLKLHEYYEAAAAQEGVPRAVLLAVGAGREQVEAIAREAGGEVYMAMDNCPHQAVLVGEQAAVERAREIVRREGLIYEQLSFDRAYHTRLFTPYTDPLEQIFAQTPILPPGIPTYSCTTAAPYPADPAAIRALMVEHWARPVEFRRTVETLYADGVRLFVEVGPRGNLSAFIEDILRGRPCCAVPANVQRRSGITQLNHLVGMLVAHGLDLDLTYLYGRRDPQRITWEEKPREVPPARSSTRVQLATSFPMLQLADEVARELRQEAGPAVAPRQLPSPPARRGDTPPTPHGAIVPVPASVAKPGAMGGAEGATSPSVSISPVPARSEPPHPLAVLASSAASTGAPQHSVVAVAGNDAVVSPVMQDYLDTMEAFLAVQEQVMLAYLQPGGGLPAPPITTIVQPLEAPAVADGPGAALRGRGATSHGAAAPALAWSAGPSAAPEANLSLMQPPATADTTASTVPPTAEAIAATAPQPAAVRSSASSDAPTPQDPVRSFSQTATASLSPATSPADGSDHADRRTRVAAQLLTLVSERTGYPVEMLDWHLDLEADLGIDSIKRVEILGSYRQQFGAVDDALLEQLSTQRTLQHIIDLLVPPADMSPSPVSPTRPASQPASIAVAGLPNRLSYPLLGSVIAWTPGEELVAQRTFDLADDLYLRDHTVGRAVSTTDPELLALAVMPLTMSLEILAEAAAALLPGRTVVGMRDILAFRWLAWDGPPQTLQVTARRLPGQDHRVAVQLRNLTEDGHSEHPPKSPVLEATVLLADTYPAEPAVRPQPLTNGRPSRWDAAMLYTEGMFHGPLWQGVSAIDQTSDNGTVARLQVLPFTGFFRSIPDPRFVLDPVALDAAGQVIGFWTMEHLATGKVIFPFRVEALEVYGPQRPVGDLITCTASIQLIGEQQVRSDIDLVGADGRLWMRLVGWEDKRFDLPVHFSPLMLSSRPVAVAAAWPAPIARFPDLHRFQCRRVSTQFPSDRTFWKHVWAQRILSRAERDQFRRLRTPENRQLEWVAGRAAAKEAVQQLLLAQYGLELLPADIEILPDARGRPVVGGVWRELVDDLPVISLAHTQGWAVALAGLALPSVSDGDGHRSAPLVGIDIEQMRSRADGFAELAFSRDEQQLLKSLTSDLDDEWGLRCWCAKEAVAKALGYGLVEGPGTVAVVAVDVAQELIAVQLTGQLARIYPDRASVPLQVYSSRHDDLVVATTLCEAVGAGLVGSAGSMV